jgi:hypothetical protein
VDCILEVLKSYNEIQKISNKKLTEIYHFVEIVFDNTGSNTGLQGLHGLLEKARRERWESYGKQRGEPWVELNVKGCDDHICNLVSKELEKRLCIRWSNWGFGGDGKRHPVSGAVIHMTKRLTSHFRRAFKAFLRENGIKPFGMTRISETRFCTHLWNNPTKQEMLHNIDI